GPDPHAARRTALRALQALGRGPRASGDLRRGAQASAHGHSLGASAGARAILNVMITQADRAAERRRLKLEDVQRQLKEGSLTIRKMTTEDRKRYPPQPAKARRNGR